MGICQEPNELHLRTITTDQKTPNFRTFSAKTCLEILATCDNEGRFPRQKVKSELSKGLFDLESGKVTLIHYFDKSEIEEHIQNLGEKTILFATLSFQEYLILEKPEIIYEARRYYTPAETWP